MSGFRGINNCNPWNVKVNPGTDAWEGQIGVDSKGHAVFAHEVYSGRACLRTLANLQLKKKAQTLSAIFGVYAPTDDGNEPNAYAAFVGKKIGVSADSPLLLFKEGGRIWNTKTMQKILEAMVEMEIFAGYKVPEAIIESAMAYYEKSWCNQ